MTYFITGTDTNVGKTVVSAWLVHRLKATYWKPIQSGIEEGRDRDTVKKLSNCQDMDIIESCYEFKASLSPHQAALLEGKTIELDPILLPYKTQDQHQPLIIEGAGGLMVPLNEKHLMIDLIQRLNVPVILVARTSLGTLNHTLLSLEALRNRAIPIAGVIAVGEENISNLLSIEQYGHTPILAHIPLLSPLCYESLSTIQFRKTLC